jgi:hypothetical protein
MGNEGIPTSILVFVLTVFLSSMIFVGVMAIVVLLQGSPAA